MPRVGSVVALATASTTVTVPGLAVVGGITAAAIDSHRVGIRKADDTLLGSLQPNAAETLITTTNNLAAYAAMVEGAAAKEGTGPLTHLSSAGVVDNLTSVGATTAQRSLDDVGDGATYKRLTGVNGTSHQAQAASVADSAIRPTHTSNAVLSVGVLRNSTHNHWRSV